MLRRKVVFIALTGLAFVLALNPVTILAQELIANNSVESATGTTPDGWNTNSWGTLNAAFQVKSPGYDGSTSLYAEVSRYQNGDAKWFPDFIAVSPSTSYSFSDYYKSNVTTNVTVGILTTDNTNEYYWLGNPVASETNFKQFNATFKTPANAKSMTVFHSLNSNGWLETDAYSLLKYDVSSTPESSVPNGWMKNSWGNLSAAFTTLANSPSGNPTLRTEVTNYVDGDAKWYQAHQNVKPSTTYTYADSYRSNVTSQATVEIMTTSGEYQYVWLGSPAGSTDFRKYSASFTTPANAKSVAVYHLLNSNGWLEITDASLSEGTLATSPEPTNPQPQEPSTSPTPEGWYTNSWGNLNAVFSSYESGQAGNPILETKVTNYQNGDAKWYQAPQNVKPSTKYTYSNSYTSDTVSNVTLEVLTTSGTYDYYWLGDPAASSTFTPFNATFTTPANAKSIAVYHLLNKNGTLQFKSAGLKETGAITGPQQFKRPLISIEFDDGWRNAYDLGFPVVEEFGFRATSYVVTNTTSYPDYMSDAQIIDLSRRGHIIGSHGLSHSNLPTLSTQEITDELTKSKLYLQNLLGKEVNEFVTPYCESNATIKSIAQQNYSYLRNCNGGVNTKENFDAYNLDSRMVLQTTTDAELRSWIKEAQDNNAWLVIVYHEVMPVANNAWAITPENLRRQMRILKESGVTVKTSADAFAEVSAQL